MVTFHELFLQLNLVFKLLRAWKRDEGCAKNESPISVSKTEFKTHN